MSGTLALLLAQGLSPSAAVDRLLANLDHSGSCGLGCRGRLDAKAAVTAVAAAPSTSAPPAGPPAVVAGSDEGRPPLVPIVALVLAAVAAVATLLAWRRRDRAASG